MKAETLSAIKVYAAYLAVFMILFVVVGSYDVQYLAAKYSSNPISFHASERMLSDAYIVAVALGLVALRSFGVQTVGGSVFVGAMLGVGAGGVAMAGFVDTWLPLVFAVSFACACILLVVVRRPFLSACCAMGLVPVFLQFIVLFAL